MDSPKILIVDDEPFNVDYLEQELEDMDYATVSAFNGREALEQVVSQRPDVILLDIMMPEMDGFQVLERLKADSAFRHIPVIIISAMDDMESVVRGIKLGAEEYLPKPFNEVLLHARIEACLERKRWHDREQRYLAEIEAEKENSERLLLNILPAPIAQRLKQGDQVIADSFDDVTVLFADIVDFTPLSASIGPRKLVLLLNEIFAHFDRLAACHGLEKIKTIGDAYMVVGGIPDIRPDHANAVAEMALDMRSAVTELARSHGYPLNLRIGMQTGPAVAGVIGTAKFSYDLWGDTVNTASRMESHGLTGQIQVGSECYERLKADFVLEQRGPVEVRGKGILTTYLLQGRK